MSEREQWRFQWPDGTWIRWNPQTQSWEKEEGQGDAPRAPAPTRTAPRSEPVAPPARPVPPAPTVPTPTSAEAASTSIGWKPLGEPETETTTEPQPMAAEPEEEPSESADVPAGETQPQPVEPQRGPRLGVSDVIPPREPERPGGSLWPTIVGGAAVGIGVGLLLSSVVR